MNQTAQISTSALHSSFGLYGFCVAAFLVAALLRTKLVPAVHAGGRKLSSTWLMQKLPWLGKGADFASQWAAFGLAVVAVTLFALSGIAATATILPRWFSDLAKNVVGPVVAWVLGFAHWHPSPQLAGEWFVSLIGIAVFLGLIAAVLHGHVHKGEKDMIIWFGPILFALVPGLVGHWSADIYNWIAQICGPLTAHWF